MPYCEITGYRFGVRVEYEMKQDVGENRTTVRVRRVDVRSLWNDLGNCWMIGTVRVNGSTAVNMILTNYYACAFTLSSSYDGCDSGSQGFTSTDVVIPHNPDGTAPDAVFAIDVRVRLTTNRALDPSVSGSVRIPLARIPRVSGIFAEPVELGKPMTVKLSRSAADFRDAVSWECGNESGVISEVGEETEFTFTPPLTLAMEVPDSVLVPVTLQVTTYFEDKPIGSAELTLDCRVPDRVVPTVSIAVSDKTGYAPAHGGYIQGRSQAWVRSFAAGAYGSIIRDIAVTCGGSTGSGADVTFALPTEGRQAITVTVTDSRGRKAKTAYYIQVQAYSVPSAAIRRVFRCDAQGNEQADGAYATIVFDGTVTAIRGNTAGYQLLRQVRGGDALPAVPLTEYDNVLQLTDGQVMVPAGLDSSYDCHIRVQDRFSTGESLMFTIPVAFVLLDVHRDGRAVGIGMRARQANALSIGMNTDMDSHRLINLPEPIAGSDAATVDYVNRRLRELAALLGAEFA